MAATGCAPSQDRAQSYVLCYFYVFEIRSRVRQCLKKIILTQSGLLSFPPHTVTDLLMHHLPLKCFSGYKYRYVLLGVSPQLAGSPPRMEPFWAREAKHRHSSLLCSPCLKMFQRRGGPLACCSEPLCKTLWFYPPQAILMLFSFLTVCVQKSVLNLNATLLSATDFSYRKAW